MQVAGPAVVDPSMCLMEGDAPISQAIFCRMVPSNMAYGSRAGEDED